MDKIKISGISLAVALALGLTGCNSTNNQTAATPTAVEQQVQHELTFVRNVEGINEYTMSNGLKVLLFKDDAQPKTLVNITYRVGSVHENYGETGMAHLLEHMLFKGSTNYQEIDKEFTKRGMATNATTWLDRTNYFEVFESNEENLAWSIGMEADRMINATFTEDELKSEMTVVRNEMERGENNPIRILISRMSSMAHLWHNYGNSTIGARSDVENFPFSKLRAFYNKHYRPDNAVLTIAGRFDEEKTIALINQHFGKIKQPETPVEALYTQEPTQDGERVVNLRRTGDLPYIGLMYHAPSGLHQDAAALEVLMEILSDDKRGRLQKQLVETGISSSAFAFSFMLKDSSQMIFLAQGEKGEDTTELEQSLLKIAENIEEQPITEAELKAAKAKFAKQAEQAMRNVTGIGMNLSEYIAKGDYRHAFYFRDQVAEVKLEDVQRVAETYLISSNRTLGRFIPTDNPERAEIPEAPDMDELLKDYKGKAQIVAGENYDNTVANIKARLVEKTWPQGTEFMFYPKQLRGDEVLIKMEFPTGTPETLHGKAAEIEVLAQMLQLGTTTMDKAEIAGKLDELKSSVRFSASSSGLGVNIKTDKNNMNATLDLVKEMLTNSTFSQTELDILKPTLIAGYESERKDPSSIANNSFRATLNSYPKGHPRAHRSIDESIEQLQALTSDSIKSVFTQHMNISNGYIAAVGNVDGKALEAKLQDTVGHLVTDTPYEYMPAAYKDVHGLTVSHNTPDKANAQLYVINPTQLTTQDEDYLATQIAAEIFGGSTFTSRLGKRIRVTEGYSYSVGGNISVSDRNEPGIVWGYAISAPENMDNVIAAYKEEIAKVVKDGFTEEEFETAKSNFINSRKRRWASDSAILSMLIDNKEIDRDIAYYPMLDEKLNTLTLEDVKAAFIKYMATNEINVFKAGDFEKVAEQ
ncbi:insulinase family protein [Thalassotalea sp. LPB0316]|uniref:M16 family metallopeptidase n=1 Tax=Thalassotalea sp. LPB0316 TaxID=2769490 RepID=UPI0018691F28|nr:pitrilysin family protein [Thalassotalea sp. LPB0316]QOL24960.1 insulinase family protein [Thalassotalea sp. LPB0316]